MIKKTTTKNGKDKMKKLQRGFIGNVVEKKANAYFEALVENRILLKKKAVLINSYKQTIIVTQANGTWEYDGTTSYDYIVSEKHPEGNYEILRFNSIPELMDFLNFGKYKLTNK